MDCLFAFLLSQPLNTESKRYQVAYDALLEASLHVSHSALILSGRSWSDHSPRTSSTMWATSSFHHRKKKVPRFLRTSNDCHICYCLSEKNQNVGPLLMEVTFCCLYRNDSFPVCVHLLAQHDYFTWMRTISVHRQKSRYYLGLGQSIAFLSFFQIEPTTNLVKWPTT